MKIKELKQILEQYPEELEIWVSDSGYIEGAERLTRVAKMLAYQADLNGDCVDDEYLYIEDDTDIKKYVDNGYTLLADKSVLTKEIIILNNYS
jgi:hypothetical protein